MSSSQTPKEVLDKLHRPVPMPVAQAARVIEDDYMRALREVRMYARQLDHVPDNVAEENDKTHAQDKDLAVKRVLYRQAGLFKMRREFLDNKSKIETLEAEFKAAKKLREKFKIANERGDLQKRQKILSNALADPNGYVNRVRQAALQAERAVESKKAEIAAMKKESETGENGKAKKAGLMDRFKIKIRENELTELEKKSDSLKGIDIDLNTPQFKHRVELEMHSLRTARTQARNTRKNLDGYIAEAEEKLSPRHKALEAVWRMERYGYADINVPLIKKKDPAIVTQSVYDAQAAAQYGDDHPMATPEDLLARFDASYRQAEIAADIAPELLDEIENDMRILQKELKKTKLGKKLLKEDIQTTKKDFSFRTERRTGGLIDMIRDIFTKGRNKANDNKKKKDRSLKP